MTADGKPPATVSELAAWAAKTHSAAVAMRYTRDGALHELSYVELAESVSDIADGLVALGVRPGDKVALLAETRPEWTICDLAIASIGAVCVPVYPTSSAQECAWVLGDSEARAVICENLGHFETIGTIRDALPGGAVVTGVLPEDERQVTAIADKVVAGSFDALKPGEYGIVLGTELAKALGIGLGDRVVITTSLRTITPAGVMPRWRGFKVVGLFSAGMYEFDRNLAYVHIADAARLYQMGEDVTGLRLKLVDMFAAPLVVRELARSLGGGYYIDDWTRKHANFFRSIQLTKSALFIILLLVVGVAAFNIVSTLVMVVKDKRSDIAILRTLGAAPRSVLVIFLTQGIAIGAIGTLAGVLLGVLISVNLETLIHGLEALLGLHFLDAKVYYITDLPARVEWSDVLQISLTAFGLCCLSTLYPSWRAARTQPAQSLRHE